MKTEIISIVSEILPANNENTNVAFLEKQLEKIGISTVCHTVVGNNKTHIKRIMRVAESRANIIIFSANLLPPRHLTIRETLSEYLSIPLVTDYHLHEDLIGKNSFLNYGDLKQDLLLQGSRIFPSLTTKAGAFSVVKNDCIYMVLPNFLVELKTMLENFVTPYLLEYLSEQKNIFSRTLRLFNISGETVKTKLAHKFIELPELKLSIMETSGEVEIIITAETPTKEQSKQLSLDVESEIADMFGEYIYGYDDDSLLELFLQTLRSKGQTIAVAESLTGGLFQQELTSIPGISDIYTGGMVVYTEETKQNILGVPPSIINKFGVVSSQCAMSMAEQIRKKFLTTIGLSFTGVAGPGELENKPVGTAFIGYSFANRGTTYAKEYKLGTARTENRILLIKKALYFLLKEFR